MFFWWICEGESGLPSYSSAILGLPPLIFLKRSLVFPILLFSSISLHWSLSKVFLSLLVILWNSASRWVYVFFSRLILTSQLFIRAPQTTIFCLHFFVLVMVFITTSCTISWTSIHSYSGTLSIKYNSLNQFSLPLYNHNGFYFGPTWIGTGIKHTLYRNNLYGECLWKWFYEGE